MDGFYATYVTGHAGSSVVLFVLRGTDLIGVDSGGMKYDGKLQTVKGGYQCTLVYIVPPGAMLITGSPPPVSPQRIPLDFFLPENFTDGRVVPILTPLGPVNAKFEKIRDL